MSAFVTVRCPLCQTLNRVDLGRAKDRPVCGECRRPILLDRPLKVSAEDFEATVLRAEPPVLVDFYADWCGPCKVMAPVLDEVAGELVGRVLVVKLDTDGAPEVAQRYGIRGIPTLVLFRSGAERGRLTGVASKSDVLKLVDRAVEAGASGAKA